MALVLHPFLSMFARATDKQPRHRKRIPAGEEECQTAETNRARNQLSNTRCTELPSYHQNSQELQQDPLKHPQMLSRSNRPRQAQCIFNFPRRWQQQDRKRSWRAPERILTIKLTGRREMRSQRSRGALHGRGEEQLRCQYRPRCGERDIKVKRDRRVTRRGEAGLKKESDCREDVNRNKRWLWRWASVNVATARWTFNGTTGPGVSSGHPATFPFWSSPYPPRVAHLPPPTTPLMVIKIPGVVPGRLFVQAVLAINPTRRFRGLPDRRQPTQREEVYWRRGKHVPRHSIT